MLARTFMSAAELRITAPEHAALVALLGALERGEIHQRQLDMLQVVHECGTIGCMLAHARLLAGYAPLDRTLFNYGDLTWSSEGWAPHALSDLFMFNVTPLSYARYWASRGEPVTPEQCARALAGYLTVGDAQWEQVLEPVAQRQEP